jgi:tungstate transport system substrate-binding protein
MRLTTGAILFLGCLFGPGFWTQAVSNQTVLLATTTSTRDSGLLDLLLPVFEKQTGYQVKTIAVGTGQALTMGRRGDADVLLTHAPKAEQTLVEAGWVVDRVPFMYNDFVIVGAAADPAQVRQAPRAADAFRRIAEAKAGFVSRADQSGTHQTEQALWQLAQQTPRGDWYVEAGQGMGATLRLASEKQVYTLTDRATYLHLQPTLSLAVVYAGDPLLRNVYSVMRVSPEKHSTVHVEGAKAFHGWLLSQAARELIRHYGEARFGQPLFCLGP